MTFRILSLLSFLFLAVPAPSEEPPLSAADRESLRRDLTAQLATLDADLSKTPTSTDLLSARGDAHLFLGEFTKAVADYEKMIELDPALDAPHWRLGIAYYFARQWEKSSRQFAKYHAYDGHDRENGVWKYFADVQWHGQETAKREMLAYTAFDREPFPSLYRLLAGELAPEKFWADLKSRNVMANPNAAFYAEYYSGVQDGLLGRPAEGLQHIRTAVSLFSPAEAKRNGPGYMWQAARVHYDVLAAGVARP